MPKSDTFNLDCLPAMRKMRDKQFDLAIVDPPYGFGDLDAIYKHGTLRNGTIHTMKQWNAQPPPNEYFTELHRVSSNQIIWGCNYYKWPIPSPGRIVFDKELNIKHTKLKYSECELASCSLQSRVTLFRYRWYGNVQGDGVNYSNTGLDGRIHPTQKPVALYKWLLTNYAKQGDSILDTHLGSGSSRIAAYDLGFDFTGYELDKDYFDAQEERFQRHIAQGHLFEVPKAEAEQERLFATA